MFAQLALVVTAGLLGPLLAAGRRPLAPVLVGELAGGAILGRTGFGVIDPAAQPFPAFYAIGFAMLMLDAGHEVDIRSPHLRTGIVRGSLAMLVAFAAGIPLALLLQATLHVGRVALFVVLLAGSSAAVAFPTIEERRLTGPAVLLLIGWITMADAVTALLMPLTLVGASKIPMALLGDVLIVIIASTVVLIGARWIESPAAKEAALESKNRRWALRLRLSVLFLLVLAAIAEGTGASMLVAGFAAGIVIRRFGTPRRLRHELLGLASGFFVPAFFVLLGATLDLRALAEDPTAIVLALTLAVAAVTVHLAAAAVSATTARIPSGLLASAQLGLPAAAASLGLSTHVLSPPIAAALVAAGVLTIIPATIGATLLSAPPP